MVQASHDFTAHQLVFHTARKSGTIHVLQPIQAAPIDPVAEPPDIRLIDTLGADLCLKHAVLPWRHIGGATVILCADVAIPDRLREDLRVRFGDIRLALCGAGSMQTALMRQRGGLLAHRAETCVPKSHSCRNWHFGRARMVVAAIGLALLALTVLAPAAMMIGLIAWACCVMLLNISLRMAAALSVLLQQDAPASVPSTPVLARLPVVSILVPLYHEKEVASHIVLRLDALDYPRELLDVCLIVEDDDALTRAALERTALPDWAQVIEVPRGTIRTKPRALNFAMTRARGSIIGIYDAEDAPEPRQLRKVVQRFAERPPEVACLQGQLDYYNPRSNWIARCFTLEYATWFRLILPGMERLGLVIPLGGTTLFLRRGAIENVCGWDAHNVTEDADLGLRLARAGYRTEVIETVTMEEANARLWPWVRQRSRWLKGYAMTYAVHMRRPLKLLQELGAWRFFGVQLLFLGTLSAFVLAPVLWSFWLVVFGLPHPLNGVIQPGVLKAVGLMFITTELINILIVCYAAHRAGKLKLALWAPAFQIYFPLATLAAYKGLAEMVNRPFFWDKTEHGLHAAPVVAKATPPPQPFAHLTAAE